MRLILLISVFFLFACNETNLNKAENANKILLSKELRISKKGVIGFTYKRRIVADDRHKVVDNIHSFIVKEGDCLLGEKNNDCKTHRERAEIRSIDHDKVGEYYCYSFSLKIPENYLEMSPKQTLGQWHDGVYGDAFSNRYENEKLFFSQQLAGKTIYTYDLPYEKGKWLKLTYRFKFDSFKGSFEVWADNKKVINKNRRKTITPESHFTYFKLGLYRSHLNRFKGKKKPTQIVQYRDVKRWSGETCLNYK
jgi:hypothetical protein